MARTRSAAARLVAEGHVRINGRKADQPAKAVGPGDVITLSLERGVRVLRVLGPGERRGPFEEARLLYEDIGGGGIEPDEGGP
ncbi:MAG: RNA-binding domain protein [Hyphomicrobiales bacterium]|nr:RNA-binding domain protein [Hyphomicrobiales bacterium]